MRLLHYFAHVTNVFLPAMLLQQEAEAVVHNGKDQVMVGNVKNVPDVFVCQEWKVVCGTISRNKERR